MLTMTAGKPQDDLTKKTPFEVDTALADHHDKHGALHREQDWAADEMHRHAGSPSKNPRGDYGPKKWIPTHDEVAATDHTTLAPHLQAPFTRARDKYHALQKQKDEVGGHISRHNAEFQRRGGWSRFFVVPDGHIHSSMHCHSTYATTEHAWLPDVSGKSEKEAVAAHGPTLCTHCFKSAPVEFKRKPSDVRREQNAGAKAEKAKAKADKEQALKEKRRGPAVQSVPSTRSALDDHLDKAHEMPSRARSNHPLGDNYKALHDSLHESGGMPFEHKHETPAHPPPTSKNIKTHMRAHHGTTPKDLEWANSINGQAGLPSKTMEEAHAHEHRSDHYDPPKHTHGEPKTATMRTALDDTQAPTQVDTLRDSNCPVCGEQDSWNGDECNVCKYVKPPDAFDDPNLDVAKQMDLRDNDDGIGGLDPNPKAQETDAAQAPSLFVPPAGSENPPGEDGGYDEDEEMGLGDDQEGEVDPEDDEVEGDEWLDDAEEDDEEDDDDEKKRKRKQSSLPAPGSAHWA